MTYQEWIVRMAGRTIDDCLLTHPCPSCGKPNRLTEDEARADRQCAICDARDEGW